jgi:periplasmic divalent cation tolerance protein
MSDFCLVYVTTPDQAVAEVLAERAVEGQLAACANILPGMVSIYRWQGKLERASESVLILKTRVDLAAELKTMLTTHHPYETPCILVLPIADGHQAFLDWIAGQTIKSSNPV